MVFQWFVTMEECKSACENVLNNKVEMFPIYFPQYDVTL
jgi:hypothetical protein